METKIIKGSFSNIVIKKGFRRLIIHVAFWICQFYLFYMLDDASLNFHGNRYLLFFETLKNTLIPAIIFYSLMYYLVPVYLLQKRYIIFILLCITLFLLAGIMDTYAWRAIYHFLLSKGMVTDRSFYLWVQGRGIMSIFDIKILINKFFVIMRFLSFPIFIKTTRFFYSYRSKQMELEKQIVKEELLFLKAQIRPHVLFNSFNNIYSLIMQRKIELAAEVLERLSDFLRTILYEGQEEFTLISEELRTIRNLVQLEQIKNDKIKVSYNEDVSPVFLGYKIPTLLYFPIIENAFKHCNTNVEDKLYVQINVEIKNRSFILNTKNSIWKSQATTNPKGIGLNNVEKRLNIYYADNYEINKEISQIEYNLCIKINKLKLI